MDKKKILIIVTSILTIAVVSFIVFKFLSNKEPITYNVSFNTNGGTAINTQIVKEGEMAQKPNNPIKNGYTFAEWTLNGRPYNFNVSVTENIMLTARWIKNDAEIIIVKFNSDGGSAVTSQKIEKGSMALKPDDPTKKGYKFKTWTLNGDEFDFKLSVDKNIELKAEWEKEEEKPASNNNTKPVDATPKPTAKKYTVTFDSDGGSTVGSQTITEGNKASRPSNPSKNGYTFVEWTLNGNSYDFNSSIKGNITLKAVWRRLNNYTVSFNSNGGSAVSSQTVTEGNKASRPGNPTRTGYNFVSWTLNGANYDFNGQVNSNITLVATWSPKNYTVTSSLVNPNDPYSPDRKLTVKEDGSVISFNAVKYMDGTLLCSGSNPVVANVDIEGITSFKIELTDGTMVNATLG